MKYTVEIVEICTTTVVVEADSEDEARDKAHARYLQDYDDREYEREATMVTGPAEEVV